MRNRQLALLISAAALASSAAAGSKERLNNTRSATKFLTTLALGAAIAERAIPSEEQRPRLVDSIFGQAQEIYSAGIALWD